MLIEEGVYREYCTEKELEKGVRVCFEQELRLNFMFTVAAVATNVKFLLMVLFAIGTVIINSFNRFVHY